ncbi:MAG TPA: hypothetical protein VFX92_04425 [Candidatus Krumholzibacteria bacterium]|nr:hypothetical protein [Candidatus Krumholzibacteria bacterium]
MFGTFFRAVVVALIVVAIVGYIGLFIMAGVAGTHDVVPIPVPSTSYLSVMMGDYKDAYRAPLEYNTYRNVDHLAENAFKNKGKEIFRDDDEIVFEGYHFGIRYFNDYLLDRSTSPHTLSMVTVVRIHEKRGKYLWKFFKPIHRRLAPYLVDRMAQAAPD